MQNIDLAKIKKIFFIGIGGIGVFGGALLVLSRGMEVFGVNDDESPKTLEPLRNAGAKIFYQADLPAEALAKEGVDMYVYSDAWIYRGPNIIESAKKTGKPVLSYFEMLGVLAKEYKVIAISGTHGKTTTTAMVAEVLIEAGLDPTVIIGSFSKKFGSNFRAGESEYLVVEADEYMAHLLNFHPFISVVTNIEMDHLDFYKDLSHIENTFQKFISQTTHAVVYNGEETHTSVLVRGYKGKAIDYAKYLEKVPPLSVPGLHNRANAAATLAVADILKIKKEVTQKSVAEFSGTWRRLEKIGKTSEGTIIYDDYAHHPSEIKASLQALREL